MAVLNEGDRQALWKQFMADFSGRFESVGLSKTDAKAALDATDDWVEANAASFNSALPAAAQSGLNATQKSRLLMFVVNRRWEVI